MLKPFTGSTRPAVSARDEMRRARQLRASDTPAGADSSGLERNDFGFVVRKRLNDAALPALCKLRVGSRDELRSAQGGRRTSLGLISPLRE
jgi:hypothetical protein